MPSSSNQLDGQWYFGTTWLSEEEVMLFPSQSLMRIKMIHQCIMNNQFWALQAIEVMLRSDIVLAHACYHSFGLELPRSAQSQLTCGTRHEEVKFRANFFKRPRTNIVRTCGTCSFFIVFSFCLMIGLELVTSANHVSVLCHMHTKLR